MKQNRKPISNYCLQPDEEWHKLPIEFCAVLPNEEPYTIGFVNKEYGFHFMASVKHLEEHCCIHVSLALLRVWKSEWSEEEHLGHLFDNAHKILNLFFPGWKFERMPDAPGINFVKHYIAMIHDE